MSKKEEPWRLSDTSLFCVPNNDEFEKALSSSATPYVFMQPVDDCEAGHDLVKSILVHKVATILLSRGFCFTEGALNPLDQLKNDYFRIKADLEKWYVSRVLHCQFFSTFGTNWFTCIECIVWH